MDEGTSSGFESKSRSDSQIQNLKVNKALSSTSSTNFITLNYNYDLSTEYHKSTKSQVKKKK